MPSTAGRWARSRPITGPRPSPRRSQRIVVNLRQRPHRRAQPRLPAEPDGGAGSGAGASTATALFSASPAALRAFGRVYAAWALSQDFYRADLHLTALGAPDLATFLRTDWEERFARRPAADLLAQLRTWDAGDISDDPRYGGDLARALPAIEAKVLLMPSATDLYFRVADNEAELPHLRHGRAAADPQHLGPPRRQPRPQPAGCRLHQGGGAGVARQLIRQPFQRHFQP